MMLQQSLVLSKLDLVCPLCGSSGCVTLLLRFAPNDWSESSYCCSACGKKFLVLAGDVDGAAEQFSKLVASKKSECRDRDDDDSDQEVAECFRNVERSGGFGRNNFAPAQVACDEITTASRRPGRKRIYPSNAAKQKAYRIREILGSGRVAGGLSTKSI